MTFVWHSDRKIWMYGYTLKENTLTAPHLVGSIGAIEFTVANMRLGNAVAVAAGSLIVLAHFRRSGGRLLDCVINYAISYKCSVISYKCSVLNLLIANFCFLQTNCVSTYQIHSNFRSIMSHLQDILHLLCIHLYAFYDWYKLEPILTEREKKKRTFFDDKVDADLTAWSGWRITHCFANVRSSVFDLDIGYFQATTDVPAAGRQRKTVTADPTYSGAQKTLVTALEYDLATWLGNDFAWHKFHWVSGGCTLDRYGLLRP